jgi:uncharacterized protein YbaP (TraB family)
MLRFLRLAALALVFSLCSSAAWALPPIWVAHGANGATVLLFGSVHILPPGLDWEPPRLKAALASADDLWFEIPIDPASNLAAGQAALAAGMQPPGQTLSAQLTPADRARLAKAAATCGLPVDGIDRLLPWFADVTLSVTSYRLSGADVDDGVERAISTQAPAGLQRRAFETPAQQIGYLAAAPMHDQIASLRETLDDIDAGSVSYRRLVAAWMAGDARALRHEALTPMMRDTPSIYRTLVVARNQRWIDAITERLQGKGEAVMVVGVGHLIGPDSVPSLLRARGVRVDGP